MEWSRYCVISSTNIPLSVMWHIYRHSARRVVNSRFCSTEKRWPQSSTSLTFASVLRAQPWATATKWRFSWNDPKLSEKRLIIAEWFAQFMMCAVGTRHYGLKVVLCVMHGIHSHYHHADLLTWFDHIRWNISEACVNVCCVYSIESVSNKLVLLFA